MFDPRGVTLIDFGFSILSDFPTHPICDDCLGTADYLAPEIVTQQGSSSSAVDMGAGHSPV